MAVIIPTEAGHPLDLTEGESFFRGFWRSSQSVTIASDVITVPGSGRYSVLPQTGTADQITGITLSTEAVDGAEIELRPQTVGHTITVVHGGNIHLVQGVNVQLTTIYSTLVLRHYGSNVWAARGPATYVP
jgi:hypothetical protein